MCADMCVEVGVEMCMVMYIDVCMHMSEMGLDMCVAIGAAGSR